VFFDVLDIPLLTSLATATWDFDYVKVTGDKGKTAQDLQFPLNHSNNLYQSGGIVPKFVGGSRPDHSPMLSYRWEVVRDTLQRLRKEEGSPYDGVIVEFTNPVNGGSVGPTMSICAQLLRPGEKTLAHRENINTIFIGAEGKGYTKVGDKRIDWSKWDIFAVPSWHWHEHGNDSAQDAIIYSVSDSPVIDKLGLLCEHRKTKDGKTEYIGWQPNRLVKK
jgi:gentisate 1,2-dioxygenase